MKRSIRLAPLLATVLLGSVTALPRAANAQMVFHVEAVLEGLRTHENVEDDLAPERQAESAKLGEYRDLRAGFRARELHLFGDDARRGRYLDLHGWNVGRRDGHVGLDAGTWGGWSVAIDYDRLQHLLGNDGRLLWTQTSPGHLELPDDVQLAVQRALEEQQASDPAGITAGFLGTLLGPYLAAARPVDVGVQRDRAGATFELGKLARLGLALRVQHEDRKGTQPYGGSFGFGNAPEILAPVDTTTDDAELRGEWKGQESGAQFGLRYSRFANQVSTLYWDNPYRLTAASDPFAFAAPGPRSIGGAAIGLADLAPDNRDTMGYFNGRARWGDDWFLNGRASYQEMQQDDALLPYTLNGAIVATGVDGTSFDPTNPANLPQATADKKVWVTDLGIDMGTRFLRRVDFTVRYRYYNYGDKSRQVEIPGYARFDAVWVPIARTTVPYSYRRETFTGELAWTVGRATSFQLGIDHRMFNRELEETTLTNENALRASVVSTAIPDLSLRLAGETGRRRISGEYDAARGGGATFLQPRSTNPTGLRQFNQADRNYAQWSAQADWSLGERWTITATTQGRRDDYDASELGLRSTRLVSSGLELGWAPTAASTIFAFVDRDDLEYDLRSRQSVGDLPSTDPRDDWAGDFTDATWTAGLGWTCRKCGRWDLALDAHYSSTDGQADLTSPPGGTPDLGVPIDDYDDVRLWSVEGHLDFLLTAHLGIGVYGLWESYEIQSFRPRALTPFLPGSLSLDLANGDYQANVVGARLRLAL